MKTSAIKIVKSYFNKKNINNYKKFLNIRNAIIGVVAFVFIITIYYFLKPAFFDYESKKQIFESKIQNHFKVNSKIEGDISYKFFPRPRLNIKNLKLKFDKSSDKEIIIDESEFLVSIHKLKSVNEIEIIEGKATNQKIRLYPETFKNYIKYFQKKKVRKLILKNCKIFFIDNQNNEIIISNFNLKNTFGKNKEKIFAKGIFSENKFQLSFVNQKKSKKYLDFTVPSLKTKLKITFNEDSNLDKLIGKLNLKILNNILLLNFDGDEIFKIKDSYFRNKFLNSKISGTISPINNFYFDLNLLINQINLKKLFLSYNLFSNTNSSKQFKISKKINGKAKINLKRTETFIGRMDETNFILLFENGDLKINSGTVDLGKNGKFKFNASLLGSGKDQRINFFVSFLSERGKKFLKKFNIDTDDQTLSFNANGIINVIEKKIKFKNLSFNKEKIDGKNLNIVEKAFDTYLIKDNVLGFFDFFKVKKFAGEIFKNYE